MLRISALALAVALPLSAQAGDGEELLVTPVAYTLSGSYTVSIDNRPPLLEPVEGGARPQARAYTRTGAAPGRDDSAVELNDKPGPYAVGARSGTTLWFFTPDSTGDPVEPSNSIKAYTGARAYASNHGGAQGPLQSSGVAHLSATFRTDRWIRCELTASPLGELAAPGERTTLRSRLALRVSQPDGASFALLQHTLDNEDPGGDAFFDGGVIRPGSIVSLEAEVLAYSTADGPGSVAVTGLDWALDLAISDPGYPGCGPADLAPPFGVFDYSDLIAFMNAFEAGDPIADLAPPAGVLDFEDVLALVFLTADDDCDEPAAE